MTQCFSAPPAAAIVDRNCFSVSLYSAPKPGDMAFIRVASYYPVTMFSQVRTLPRGSAEAQYCELDVVPGDLNRFTLTGCLPQRSEPLPLAFAVQDGASYAGAILKDELKQAGITWSGTLLRQTQVNEPGTVVASKQSAPLHDLLKIMLKKVGQHDRRYGFPHDRPCALQCAWNMAGRVGRRASDPAPASRCRYWKHHYCRWFRAFAA